MCFEIALYVIGVILLAVGWIIVSSTVNAASYREMRKLALEKEKENEKFIEKSLGAQGFEITRKYLRNYYHSNGIAVDQKNKRVCIIKNLKSDVIYSFEDILAVEIIVEKGTVSEIDTVTKSSLGSQLGGAVVGGLIAGPAGLVVGGLSGKKKSTGVITTSEEITEVALNIIVKDSQNPFYSICFGRELSVAREWHAFLTVILKEEEEERTKIAGRTKMEDDCDSGVAIEICKNCDKKIGKLETAYVFNSQIVCHECYQKLGGE